MIFYAHFHCVMTRKNVMGVYLHKGLRCDKLSPMFQGDSEEGIICRVFLYLKELITKNYNICKVITLLFNIKDIILTM